MTTTITKTKLSGSTNGRPIKVAATATAGTTIHTATSTSGELDEVWLYAQNTDTTARKLTLELGGTTAPDDLLEVTIPAEGGSVLAVPGWPYDGGVIIRAFAATANVVTITGFVNNIAVT